MRKVADDLWQLGGFPPNLINVFLLGDVLVDAATRHSGRRILRQLRGRRVSAHALTHAHPDHQGASREVCEGLGIPLWCGEADADAAEDPALIPERRPSHPLTRFYDRAFTGPGHPVARRLREGDEVAGFTVLEAPGHTLGHVVFWRESDRALVLGDVVVNVDVVTGVPGLREPKAVLGTDPERNRAAARRLAGLEPAVVCFGHGAPLRDGHRFVDFVRSLPGE